MCLAFTTTPFCVIRRKKLKVIDTRKHYNVTIAQAYRLHFACPGYISLDLLVNRKRILQFFPRDNTYDCVFWKHHYTRSTDETIRAIFGNGGFSILQTIYKWFSCATQANASTFIFPWRTCGKLRRCMLDYSIGICRLKVRHVEYFWYTQVSAI